MEEMRLVLNITLALLIFARLEYAQEYYYSNWCGRGTEFLNDRKCAKVFPSAPAGECSVAAYESEDDLPEGYLADGPLSLANIDTLSKIVTNGANLCVILTKRVKGSQKLFNRYYCTGGDTLSHETWSSSKIFAMANAAGSLRGREAPTTGCAPGTAGLDAATTGKNGPHTHLGDLATIVCSYDTTAGYSSNSLASYFHDLGGRQTLHDLVQSDWLMGKTTTDSLGSNYGEATPGDLGFVLTPVEGSPVCSATQNTFHPSCSNSLSSLAAAEMTRRLVLHDSISDPLRFPLLLQRDVDSILRGSNSSSSLFPGQAPFGGMSADTAIFLQSALDMEEVERASAGRWAIYSKLGCGYSSSRIVGEIISNAYGCFPSLGGGGRGFELTLSVRGSVPNDSSGAQAEQVVLEAVRAVVSAILSGKIE